MSDAPNPTPSPTPLPPIVRDAPHSVVTGMGIVRKLLFTAPTSHDGWQKMMLTHINAAKALGFTMFEIDTVEATVPRPKKKKQEEQSQGYNVFFSSFRIVQDGEEWKAATQDEPEEAETSGTMRTTVVRVYALAIE